MATASTSEASVTLHTTADPEEIEASPHNDTPSDEPPRKKHRSRRISSRSSLPAPNHASECNDGECNNRIETEAPPTPTPPPRQKKAPDSIHKDADNGVGIRLIDINALKKGIAHLCCRECSEKRLESTLDKTFLEFFEFHNKELAGARFDRKKRPTPEESFKRFKTKELHSNFCSSFVSVKIESNTVGFATNLDFTCETESKVKHTVSVTPQKVSPSFVKDQESFNNGLFWVNYLIVIMMHRIGCGMYHAQLIAGFLGLPTFKGIPNMFRVVEEKLGAALGKVASKSKLTALEVEREATKQSAIEFGKDVRVIEGKVGICVASDTHWPRRGGGGKKYVSPSGLTYMVGSLSGMIIASHICSQDCRLCFNYEKKRKDGKLKPGEEVKSHRCPRNFAKTKSPKKMETASTALMVTSVFDSDAGVFVEYICIDDDTSMMSHLRRKCDGGSLPDYMPLNFPFRVSDLNHRIRSIAGVVFDLATINGDASRVSRPVAYRYKKSLSYFIYGMIDSNCDTNTFLANKLAPLEHMFGNHEFCTDNCPGKRALIQNEDYCSKVPPLDKEMHRDIYLDIFHATKPYFEPDRVAQIMQENMPREIVLQGTQPCEAINNADVTMAPKSRHYSSSSSILDRSATNVGTHNLGESEFYVQVNDEICLVPLNCNQLSFLEYKWKKKCDKREYQSRRGVKRKRTEMSKVRLEWFLNYRTTNH